MAGIDRQLVTNFIINQFVNLTEEEAHVAIPVIEAALGAEYSYWTDLGRLFLRAGWESQYWMNVGSTGASTAYNDPAGAVSDQFDSNLGFHGLNIGGGFSRTW